MKAIRCSVAGCGRGVIARGLCERHYRAARAARISLPPLASKPTPTERLLSFIERRRAPECWPWKGAIGRWGYGVFWLNGHNLNASRAAYLLLVGPAKSGQVVCHSCDNPVCCNPNHLWLGTQADNLRDCRRKGRASSQLEAGGSAHHPRYNAKLTPAMVIEARRLYFQDSVSQSEIGRRWGVHSSAISRAVRGENWAHVS